jgi:hypothetical protein
MVAMALTANPESGGHTGRELEVFLFRASLQVCLHFIKMRTRARFVSVTKWSKDGSDGSNGPHGQSGIWGSHWTRARGFSF